MRPLVQDTDDATAEDLIELVHQVTVEDDMRQLAQDARHELSISSQARRAASFSEAREEASVPSLTCSTPVGSDAKTKRTANGLVRSGRLPLRLGSRRVWRVFTQGRPRTRGTPSAEIQKTPIPDTRVAEDNNGTKKGTTKEVPIHISFEKKQQYDDKMATKQGVVRSVSERLRSLEEHLEQISSSSCQADGEEEELSDCEDPALNSRSKDSEDLSAFQNIPGHQLTGFDRIIVSMNQLPEKSFSSDPRENVPPIKSWLGDGYNSVEETNVNDSYGASDEETHQTFHSFQVGAVKSSDGSSDIESVVDRFAFARGTFSVSDHEREEDSETLGDDEDEEDGEITGDGTTFTDDEDVSIGSFTAFMSGDEADQQTFVSDHTDEINSHGASVTDNDDEFLSDQEDTFSEEDEGARTDTIASMDVFQYEEGRYLVVI